MNRSTELARLAVRRHQHTGIALEESIAAAIRQALSEQAGIDQYAPLPPAAAGAVRLLEQHGELTPVMIARFRAVSITAARKLVLRMHAWGVIRRVRRGVYALAKDWQRSAADAVDQWHAGRRQGMQRGAAVTNSRRVA